jgi:hypothetical protein
MKPSEILERITSSKKCPDGLSIQACASCLADRLFAYFASRCYYCHRNRYTREIELDFKTHKLIQLVCDPCGNALDGETPKITLKADLV